MVKSVLAAALLAALAMAPMPVSAQGIGFGFHYGDNPNDFLPQLPMCLTDRQIRDAIAQRGFSNIALNVPNEDRIQVRGTQEGWVYLIDFNYCADYVINVERLRPAQ